MATETLPVMVRFLVIAPFVLAMVLVVLFTRNLRGSLRRLIVHTDFELIGHLEPELRLTGGIEDVVVRFSDHGEELPSSLSIEIGALPAWPSDVEIAGQREPLRNGRSVFDEELLGSVRLGDTELRGPLLDLADALVPALAQLLRPSAGAPWELQNFSRRGERLTAILRWDSKKIFNDVKRSKTPADSEVFQLIETFRSGARDVSWPHESTQAALQAAAERLHSGTEGRKAAVAAIWKLGGGPKEQLVRELELSRPLSDAIVAYGPVAGGFVRGLDEPRLLTLLRQYQSVPVGDARAFTRAVAKRLQPSQFEDVPVPARDALVRGWFRGRYHLAEVRAWVATKLEDASPALAIAIAESARAESYEHVVPSFAHYLSRHARGDATGEDRVLEVVLVALTDLVEKVEPATVSDTETAVLALLATAKAEAVRASAVEFLRRHGTSASLGLLDELGGNRRLSLPAMKSAALTIEQREANLPSRGAVSIVGSDARGELSLKED